MMAPPVEPCAICRASRRESGDNWGKLCPGCADAVSTFLDDAGLADDRVETLITFVQRMIQRTCVRTVPMLAAIAAFIDREFPEDNNPDYPSRRLRKYAEKLRTLVEADRHQ